MKSSIHVLDYINFKRANTDVDGLNHRTVDFPQDAFLQLSMLSAAIYQGQAECSLYSRIRCTFLARRWLDIFTDRQGYAIS
jgi:hypothetical protein